MSDEGVTETVAAAVTTEATKAAEAVAKPAAPAKEAEPASTPKLSHHQRRMATFDKVKGEKDAPEAETPAVKDDPAAVAKEGEKPADKPAEKPQTPQEKADARAFAALAREKREVLDARNAFAAEKTKAANDTAAAAQAAKVNEAKAAELDRILSDPDSFFDHAFAKLGIRTKEDLMRYAAKQWSGAPKTAVAERALTQADVEKLVAEREQKRAFEEASKKAYDELDALFDIPDDDTEPKYRHAALGWTRAERTREADKIAAALQALGRRYTLEEIADAVDEAAKSDPIVLKKLKRLAKPSEKPAAAPKAAIQPDPKKPAAAPAVKPSETNGARLSHKDRMAAYKLALAKEE
jgi:hypothetical protein